MTVALVNSPLTGVALRAWRAAPRVCGTAHSDATARRTGAEPSDATERSTAG